MIPSRPDSLTEQSAVEYVEAYEYAFTYRRNTRLGSLVEFYLDGEAEPVWADDTGVHCEFDHLTAHGRYEAKNGEEYYFDMSPYSASYLVTNDAVWRAESERADQPPDPPNPREDGELLECF